MRTDPTPEEIKEGCKRIQATWTEEERLRRIVDKQLNPERSHGWSIPTVAVTMANSVLEDEIKNEGGFYSEEIECPQ